MRFVVVGASNTAISFVTYAALLWVGTVYWLAGAIAFAAGAVNGYVFNRTWTFAAADSLRSRSRYVVVQLGGLLASIGLLWFLVRHAGVGRIPAYALTLPTVTVATFLANRGWAFAAGEPS
jgi:putative flippase GtrA